MLRRRGAERGDGLAQLVGLRAVLGVVDDEELAVREVEADVARLRLRLRLAVGHDHDAHERRAGREPIAASIVGRSSSSSSSSTSSLSRG